MRRVTAYEKCRRVRSIQRGACLLVLTAVVVLCTSGSTASAAKSTSKWASKSSTAVVGFRAGGALTIGIVIRSGTVRLSVYRGTTLTTSYTASGRWTQNQVTARFGSFGSLELKVKAVGPATEALPPPGCVGIPGLVQRARFIGQIAFVGEERYVVLHRGGGAGLVRYANWNCSERRETDWGSPGPQSGVQGIAARVPGSRGPFFAAIANQDGQSPAIFVATVKEKRRHVTIEREAVAFGSSELLSVGPGGHPAVVQPPYPFTGSGEFDPNSPLRWQASLAVDFLGRSHVHLAGDAIRVGSIGPRSLRRVSRLLQR